MTLAYCTAWHRVMKGRSRGIGAVRVNRYPESASARADAETQWRQQQEVLWGRASRRDPGEDRTCRPDPHKDSPVRFQVDQPAVALQRRTVGRRIGHAVAGKTTKAL